MVEVRRHFLNEVWLAPEVSRLDLWYALIGVRSPMTCPALKLEGMKDTNQREDSSANTYFCDVLGTS